MPEPVVLFDHVSFAYDGLPIIEDACLTIRTNEFLRMVGPNGGGKTTLLRLMLGLLTPRGGRMEVFGTTPVAARPRVGYMPQEAQLDPQFPVSVLDVVLMGRLRTGLQIGPYRRRDREIARRALDEVSLADAAKRSLADLSGGQRQRVLLARALACEPQLLLLDEPTANLDVAVQEELYDLLRRLSERMAIVLVSHDVGFVSTLVQSVICVNRTVAVHPTTALNGNVITDLYGSDVSMIRHDHRCSEEGHACSSS
ncbi:ATP-binding cassette domain-containing protein [bacterium]|nr:ATP-binding cassette domain-containing protein [bacterium]